jgi:membrane protein required for colicin V production
MSSGQGYRLPPMPIADIVIAIAIVISVAVGIFRGFVKEAISIVTLLVAIWAAMNFGAYAGRWSESWVSSEGMQLWVGRILIFVVILVIGGLIGWGFSKLVRLSALDGTDRSLGALFGFGRGALLLGVFIVGGQLASFEQDDWWKNSRLIPYGTAVADWIRVMAPKGVDLLQKKESPDEPAAETAGLISA